MALSKVPMVKKFERIRRNLEQRRKVEGDSNCSDTSHHRVAEGEVIGWQERKVQSYNLAITHTTHLETKILEAAQATR